MKSRSTLTEIAKRLRSEQTDAEELMWSLLRAKRFDGYKFRRQHPMRDFVLDFYCPKLRLNIELDGGQHFDPQVFERDRRRDELLRNAGITVLRFDNWAFFKNRSGVMQMIFEVASQLASRKHHAPLPNPLPEYGERGPDSDFERARGNQQC